MRQRESSYSKKSWLKAKMAAAAVLNHYGIDSVDEIQIRDIAYARGLRVQEIPIRGAEGRLVRRGRRGIATVNKLIREPGKKRFVIAHELGHFEIHKEKPLFSCDEAAFLAWHRNRPEEVEANVFAASILMPARLFQDAASRKPIRVETIEELASLFRVTLSAAAIRYATLDIEPCAVVFSQNGKVVWYRSSDSFPYEYIPLGQPVHPFSGAGEFFAKERFSKEPELTPYEVWFSDWSLESGKRCYEQCRLMPGYNAVLSLLFLP